MAGSIGEAAVTDQDMVVRKVRQEWGGCVAIRGLRSSVLPSLDATPLRVSYHCGSAAGWSSLVARRAHNPKVAGSNPAPAIEADQAQSSQKPCKPAD